nr:hypothetical protein [Tanacetum cinerariifolium]
MHFLLTTLKVVYVLTTPMPELLEDATMEAIRIRAKWENDDYICRGHILNGMFDSLFDVYTNVESAKELWDSLESKYMAEDFSSKKFLDFKHTLKHGKDDLSLVQLGSHLRIEKSLRAQDNNKGKGKKRSNKNNSGSGSNKNPKLECWKCGKTGHFKRDCHGGKKNNGNVGGSGKGSKDQSQYQDYGATTHVCKDRCWFKTFEPVEDGYVLYMGDEHFAPVHGKGSVALEFSSRETVALFNVLYVPKLRKNLVYGHVMNKCGYKQVYEFDKYILSKCGVFVGFGYYNNGMFMLILNKVYDDSDSVYMSSSFTVVDTSLWHARLGYVHYKRMLEMSKDELIPAIDEKSDKCTTYDASRFFYVYLLHAKYEALDKFKIYKTEVELQQNDLIKTLRTYRGGEYYDPVVFQSVGVIHETTTPYTLQQNGMAERNNKALKEMINFMLSYSGLSEGFSGEAIAVVRLPDSKRITLGEKGIYCIFVGYVEHSKAYRPKDIIPNSNESQKDDHSDDVPKAIVDEIHSIMENNTWVLSDLPPGCKPLGCKWIFKKKKKVDGTIDKFKARLVIQGFRQKEGIDHFDTYAPIARITTIRLLLALAAIHNLVIHQMDVKTAFLNGDLDEEVYMKQPEGFVMPVDKTKKFLSSRFSMKDMREADVILGIKIKRENKGIVIKQSHYIEKILKKFNHEDCSPVQELKGPPM